jgi:hypothetical protein
MNRKNTIFESFAWNPDISDYVMRPPVEIGRGGNIIDRKKGNKIVKPDPKEYTSTEKFYAKYEKLLQKELNLKSDNVTFSHPSVLIFLKAIDDGDTVPSEFEAMFTGPKSKLAVYLLSKLLSKGVPPEKFPKRVVESYLHYGNTSSKIYHQIKNMFPEIPIYKARDVSEFPAYKFLDDVDKKNQKTAEKIHKLAKRNKIRGVSNAIINRK